MKRHVITLKYPELVFGIAGPIGLDIDAIIRTLRDILLSVGYNSATIKITDEISSITSDAQLPVNDSFYNMMRYKMAHASSICRINEDPSYLMRIALAAIQRERVPLSANENILSNQDDSEESVIGEVEDDVLGPFHHMLPEESHIAYRSAYIIRQIKRPQEVKLLRNIYGKQFILISAYGSQEDRVKILREKIKETHRSELPVSREIFLAEKLVELDMSEDDDKYGQHTRDAFHLADVVIDGIQRTTMQADLDRFVKALFGLNEIAPNRAEYGMNAAYSASLRSSDLSRQVGASIFSQSGEILAQGCNEVPRAFGGTYWDGEQPDNRDVKIGRDSNDILKIDVLKDLVERLKRNGLLSAKANKAGSPARIVNFLIGREKVGAEFESLRGVLKNSKILDLTEYGRVVHAEMNAICDAARIGIPLRDGTLYSTTFPCHNCTKHILAAGIKEVFFLEPYPKSKAKELHDNEICIETVEPGKVSFRPFRGITPQRYGEIFSKHKRKKDGLAVRWQFGGPAPMIDVATPDYLRLEDFMKIDIEKVPPAG